MRSDQLPRGYKGYAHGFNRTDLRNSNRERRKQDDVFMTTNSGTEIKFHLNTKNMEWEAYRKERGQWVYMKKAGLRLESLQEYIKENF